jgi:uncharacterized membrane protein YdbT with pleckstrin-like domain
MGGDSILGEGIAYRARLHWVVFAPPLVMFVAGLAAIAFQPATALALLVASAIGILAAYAKYMTTEILVTPRRIVYRTGLFARRSVEMHRDKIESIDVSQSLPGRLLDFGAVAVKGTGGGIEAVHNVAGPVELRNHVANPRAAIGRPDELQFSPLWGTPKGAAQSSFDFG